MYKKKIRADQLLVNRGIVSSRERAKRIIMAGKVWRVGQGGRERIQKAGEMVEEDIPLEVENKEEYVSRGAYKLLTAVSEFDLKFKDKVVLDVGASTGGFTHVALKGGARRVYCVDVGYGQLHYNLRKDRRVVNLERVNMRYADNSLIPEKVDMVLIDCSFISLLKIIPPCLQFLRQGGELVCLIKPQFELSPSEVKKGVVKAQVLQKKAIDRVIEFCVNVMGLEMIGVVASKIKGPKGNQEYLAYFRYGFISS